MPKVKAKCSQCGKDDLLRWPINPVTKNTIENFFCDNNCKADWQVSQRESLGFNREWLFDQYVTKGKDANQIGREVGRDGKSVWNWLARYDIPRRPRGHTHEQNLVKDGSNFRGKKHSEETKKKISELSKADGRVPWGKHNPHPLKGGNPENHPNYKGGITPERQAFYASREWVESVKAVWERDNATCQQCGKHHNTTEARGTFHIHHIVSFMVRELRSEVSNLVLLCDTCHRWVHGKLNKEKKFIRELKDGRM